MLAVILVAAGASVVYLLPGIFKPIPQTLNPNAQFPPPQMLIYVHFQMAMVGGSGVIPIAVVEGSGQICAQDLTSNAQPICTSTTTNVPVAIGDSVRFSASPDPGQVFVKFQAGGGAPPTQLNPVTAEIVQQTGGDLGYVHVYFQSSSVSVTVTSSTTVTSSSSQTTTPSFDLNSLNLNSIVPVIVLIIILLVVLYIIVRIFRS